MTLTSLQNFIHTQNPPILHRDLKVSKMSFFLLLLFCSENCPIFRFLFLEGIRGTEVLQSGNILLTSAWEAKVRSDSSSVSGWDSASASASASGSNKDVDQSDLTRSQITDFGIAREASNMLTMQQGTGTSLRLWMYFSYDIQRVGWHQRFREERCVSQPVPL